MRFWIDDNETYGRHVIERFVRSVGSISSAADLGAGRGKDLSIIKRLNPEAVLYGLEADPDCKRDLIPMGVNVHEIDLERDCLPFAVNSLDLIVANQILEHTKEIFWIFDQVTRSLKAGGHFIIGVPNIASLHNRLLMLLGGHPTQHKLASAHVRPFSKNDTLAFLSACWPNGYALRDFGGAQFYPFPRAVARPLSTLWPTASFSIFFLLRKEREYEGEFLAYPVNEKLETNFWLGS